MRARRKWAKRCCKCRKVREAPTDFHRRAQAADGLQSQCRTCDAERSTAKRKRTKSSSSKCKKCCDLPWRRQRPVCRKCFRPYSPEPEQHAKVERRYDRVTTA